MSVRERLVRSECVPEDPDDWIEAAACRRLPTSIFFPEGGVFAIARGICASCSVLERCRLENDRSEAHLARSQVFGFYAGETPRERIERRSTRSR